MKEKNFKILGKEELFNEQFEKQIGFSQSIKYFKNMEDYIEQLEKVKNNCPKQNLIGISLTSAEIMKEQNYNYMPSILAYKKEFDSIVNPIEVFKRCLVGEDEFSPNVDFIIFFEEDNTACFAYSKGAPVLLFESEDKTVKCLGTILRPALINYGEYIFNKIKEYIGPNMTVKTLLCAGYKYNDYGQIEENIKALAQKTDIQYIEEEYADPYNDDKYFGLNDDGNNVVIAW